MARLRARGHTWSEVDSDPGGAAAAPALRCGQAESGAVGRLHGRRRAAPWPWPTTAYVAGYLQAAARTQAAAHRAAPGAGAARPDRADLERLHGARPRRRGQAEFAPGAGRRAAAAGAPRRAGQFREDRADTPIHRKDLQPGGLRHGRAQRPRAGEQSSPTSSPTFGGPPVRRRSRRRSWSSRTFFSNGGGDGWDVPRARGRLGRRRRTEDHPRRVPGHGARLPVRPAGDLRACCASRPAPRRCR
jgi:hypothetical protein